MHNASPPSPNQRKKSGSSKNSGKSRFKKIFDWFSNFEFDYKVKTEYKFVMIFGAFVVGFLVIGIFIHLYRMFSA